MLMPKRVKHRKVHRGNMRGRAARGNFVAFGEFGLQALEAGWVDSRQIEAARRAITRYVRRGGKMWIRIFPDKSVTAKPAETRMGSGKGAPDHWVAVVKPDRIMFEIAGIRPEIAMEALRLAGNKLPIKTKFVTRVTAPKPGTTAEELEEIKHHMEEIEYSPTGVEIGMEHEPVLEEGEVEQLEGEVEAENLREATHEETRARDQGVEDTRE